jgi:hypothetical protein
MSKFNRLPDVVVAAIRGGWRDLRDAMGGTDRAARVCGVGISQVSTYGSEHGDSMPTLATVFLAERDTGKPYITSALASATGHILVPVEPVAKGELASLLCMVGGEVGEMFSTYGAALANDGVLDAGELAEVRRKAGDAKRAIYALISHLEQASLPSPAPGSTRAGGAP